MLLSGTGPEGAMHLPDLSLLVSFAPIGTCPFWCTLQQGLAGGGDAFGEVGCGFVGVVFYEGVDFDLRLGP